MSDAVPLLEARGLGKAYRMGKADLRVLSGVDLRIPTGSYVTIRGASGSGKSTLLQLLGGLQQPDAGTILWKGEPLSGLSRARLAAWRGRHVGFIFQSYQLLPELSALENVELPAALRREEDPARGLELLKRVGLAARAAHRPAELSGGEQQRVAIARALRNSPDVILADEPTGNLDRESGLQVVALLEELHREGRTLVVVTHDEALAARGGLQLSVAEGRLQAPA